MTILEKKLYKTWTILNDKAFDGGLDAYNTLREFEQATDTSTMRKIFIEAKNDNTWRIL